MIIVDLPRKKLNVTLKSFEKWYLPQGIPRGTTLISTNTLHCNNLEQQVRMKIPIVDLTLYFGYN